jgi:cytochrome P450
VASNLIGIMTGFLPPADGNLRLALNGWLEEKELWRVQHRLTSCSGDSAWDRASTTLRPALIRAMRERPAPDMVLRTAREDHQLGGLTIRSGEEIYVGIIGASQQDLDDGDTDSGYVVFGGNRDEKDAPVHACPGYKFAMGTMLGILSALFEKCRIEALPAPLKVQITDPNWQPAPSGPRAPKRAVRQEARPRPAPAR